MAKRMREKAAKRLENRDKRPQATAKFVRISPSKVHIVLDIIRGQDYNNALAILKNTPKAASEILVKVLESAGANAENNLNLSKNDLYVAECFANEGSTYKRHWLRSRGSADLIKKRTSHITIILDEKENQNKSSKQKTKKETKQNVVEKEVKAEPAQSEVAVEPAKTTEKKSTKTSTKPATKSATKTTTKSTAKKADEPKSSKQGGNK